MVFKFTRRGLFSARAAAVLGLALAAFACSRRAPTSDFSHAASPPVQTDDVRRLASLLDYVASDYAGAVADGRVVKPTEYEEQRAFVRDASDLARRLPASALALATDSPLDTSPALAAIGQLLEAKAPPAQVALACRTLRRRVLDAYGVVIAPTAPPSLPRATALYAQACAVCHGAKGDGHGEQAPRLNPPPRSFHDAQTVAELSPLRVFNALTDGVSGTAMPSFGVLAPSDRWSLAFYVLALRQDREAAVRGRALYEHAAHLIAATPTRLSALSDAELEQRIHSTGLDAPSRSALLAFFRKEAPFRTSGAPFDPARQQLGQLVERYAGGRGNVVGASAANGIYLDAIEPHEGALRARDADLVVRIEERFLALRTALDASAPPGEVERVVLQLGSLLDRADETLSSSKEERVAFIGALVVVLREGVEAALLLMMLVGLARRAGAGEDVRAVHWGWLAATAAGVLTWIASAVVLRLGGARREILEAIFSLAAAGLLVWAGHFVLARLDANRRVEALRRRFSAAPPMRRRFVLFGLGFMALYREAFEIVLFLRALTMDTHERSGAVAAGAAAGALACILFVLLLGRLGRRLRPARLLTASGSLLYLLAVILAGKGVRAFQEAGTLGIHPLGLPRIEWLGLFPTVETVGAQLAILLLFAIVAALALSRARRPVDPPARKEASIA